MQAPRNWRTKQERYRLTGSVTVDGEASVVNRPPSLADRSEETPVDHHQPVLEVNAA
ncbi:MAG: hypothetical protein WBC91_04215 [Phototrophicaceae bacterium]